jgi:hypothetical protein
MGKMAGNGKFVDWVAGSGRPAAAFGIRKSAFPKT